MVIICVVGKLRFPFFLSVFYCPPVPIPLPQPTRHPPPRWVGGRVGQRVTLGHPPTLLSVAVLCCCCHLLCCCCRLLCCCCCLWLAAAAACHAAASACWYVYIRRRGYQRILFHFEPGVRRRATDYQYMKFGGAMRRLDSFSCNDLWKCFCVYRPDERIMCRHVADW